MKWHDALKNTTALFGILGGRRASYTYGAYGQTLSMDGNAYADNPFRYSSEYFDEELGMISYNFRRYNPLDGRWITRDSIGEMGGLHVYGFLQFHKKEISSVGQLTFEYQNDASYWENRHAKKKQENEEDAFFKAAIDELPSATFERASLCIILSERMAAWRGQRSLLSR